MARPRKQTVPYFTHDCDASNPPHQTLIIMKGAFGLAGAGFWWELLQWLGQSNGHFIDVRKPQDFEFLLRNIGVETVVSGAEMLDKLAFLGSIDPVLWSHRIIYSQNFVDRLSDVYKKREGGMPQKPCFCNGNCDHSDITGIISAAEIPENHTETTQSKVKYSKVKYSNNNELPEWVDKELWESFMEVRKGRRAVHTPRAMQLLINRLDKLRVQGNDPTKVLEQSIMNSWKGVFPLKYNGLAKSRTKHSLPTEAELDEQERRRGIR